MRAEQGAQPPAGRMKSFIARRSSTAVARSTISRVLRRARPMHIERDEMVAPAIVSMSVLSGTGCGSPPRELFAKALGADVRRQTLAVGHHLDP